MSVAPVFAAANMDFARNHDAEHVEHLTKHTDAVGMVESKDLHAARLMREGWTAHQDRRNPARAGSAIALRDTVLRVRYDARLRLKVGARPWIRGRRIAMLTRYIACLPVEHVETGDRFFLVVPHFAPPRYQAKWKPMVRRLRRILRKHPNAVVLTDANMPAAQLVELLDVPGLDYFGSEVMAVLWNRRRHRAAATEVTVWGRRHKATTHPTVVVQLAQED